MYNLEALRQQLPSTPVPCTKVNWPAAQHDAFQRIDERSLEWAERQGLLLDDKHRERAKRLAVGSFSCRVYPNASEAFIQIMADYLLWFYVIDDLYVDRVDTINDDTVRNLTAVIDIMDLLELKPDSPFGAAPFLNLCLRLKDMVPVECFERWAEGMRLWAFAGSLMILGESRPGACKLPQYEVIRRYLSGVMPFVACSDYANGGNAITSSEFYDNNVQKLVRFVCNITAWSNDNDSLAAELYQPGQQMNMTILRACENGFNLREAVQYTDSRVRTEIEEYERVQAEVLGKASDALRGYCLGLQHWISGFRDWVEFDTCRYDAKFAIEECDDRGLVHIAQAVAQAVSV
ncbi:Pentalenene synthase [Escovopsis weberi]|uniref:Terpene synthase n=1 Tax=Escovopsis weberi TaxID=150374 RepID=A0A0M8N2Y4_ESCWE|nr:Pentalenene synthase [Escovopsis weberi]